MGILGILGGIRSLGLLAEDFGGGNWYKKMKQYATHVEHCLSSFT